MTTILTNDIKAGTPIRLSMGRVGIMRDNKKGIARVVEVEVPGQGIDIGATYINEILWAEIDDEWVRVTMTPAHKKQLDRIGWI